MNFSKISAIEYYLPSKVSTKEDLLLDNPDWRMDDIEEKTGVKRRFICDKDETAKDISILACNQLIGKKVNRDEIEFLIIVTESPEHILPPLSCTVQDCLGLSTSIAAFDVNLGCSGFVYGLMLADSIICSQGYKKGILVCVDTYSKYIADDDRTCRPLFSDAASAILISSSNKKTIGPFVLGTDGSGSDDLVVKNSGTKSYDTSVAKSLFMNGSQVFMFTMRIVPKMVNDLLKKSNHDINDIDLFIFHQASKLVLDNIERLLKIPGKKVFKNYSSVGNTVSSSIPIALAQAEDQGMIKKDSLIMLAGFGVGLSWGATLISLSKK
jgi:3-oxoacyl-[acyl-carrier-protein] synthase III